MMVSKKKSKDKKNDKDEMGTGKYTPVAPVNPVGFVAVAAGDGTFTDVLGDRG